MISNLIPYAMDFTSYMLQKISKRANIREVILFGSAARGEDTPESDVDIFIDTTLPDKAGPEIKKIIERFKDSTKFKNYWKPLGVENDIKPVVGKLKEWKSLKISIVSDGITLYGKYKSDLKGDHKVFLVWENVNPNSKRVLFNKYLFGFNQNNKRYPGLIEKFHAKKLGKGCIEIPLEHYNEFLQLFRKFKVTVIIKKVIEY